MNFLGKTRVVFFLVILTFVVSLIAVTPFYKEIKAQTRLDEQIIIDSNSLYLVYNRDVNGDGKKDPFLGVGPGDPEDFLYRGDWQTILNAVKSAGANTMYAIVVGNYNNVGDCKIANCNPFYPGTNSVDPSRLDQIYTRVKALSDAGIVTWLFLYDDAMCVFGNCASATVPSAETTFINALVNKLESIPLLIWVVAEEYQEAFGVGSQRVRNIAASIKQADDYDHIVGLHHATGDNTFDFSGDVNIDQFSHQASPTSPATLHSAVLSAVNSVRGTRHHVAMVEAHPYHENLLKSADRTNLRRSGWANALAGVHVLYLCTWRSDRNCPAPSSDMLADWGRIRTFMESTNFNEMNSRDDLATGSTEYVLARVGESYIAYTDSYSLGMGVAGLVSGSSYTLKWLDAISGQTVAQKVIVSGTSQIWVKPSGLGNELALYITREEGLPTETPVTGSPTPSSRLGDANGDGLVDGLDFIAWLVNFGKGLYGSQNADFNLDQVVNILDYGVWIDNY